MVRRALLFLALIIAPAVASATVTSQTFSVSFTCTGSTGPYAFTFPISDPTALTVYQNGTALMLGAWSSVPVNNNYENGGSVTLVTACPSGSNLLLVKRQTPLTQTTVFTENMPQPMKSFEYGLDKLTEIAQESSVSLFGIPYCTGFVPTPGQTVSYTTPGNAPPCWQSAAISGGGGGGGGGICEDCINVMTQTPPAACDGITDDTAVFQNAIGAACAAHTSVYVPGTANGCKVTKSLNASDTAGCLQAFWFQGDPGSGFWYSQIDCELTEAYPCIDFGGVNSGGINNMRLSFSSSSLATAGILQSSGTLGAGGGFNWSCLNSYVAGVYPNPSSTYAIVAYQTDQDNFDNCQSYGSPGGWVIGNSVGRATSVTSKFYSYPPAAAPGFTEVGFHNIVVNSMANGQAGPALEITGINGHISFTGQNYLSIFGGTSNVGGILEMDDPSGGSNQLDGWIRTEGHAGLANVCVIKIDGPNTHIDGGTFSGVLNAYPGGIDICGGSNLDTLANVNWNFVSTNPTAFSFPGNLQNSNISMLNGGGNSTGSIGNIVGGSLYVTQPEASIKAAVTGSISQGAYLCGTDICENVATNLNGASGSAHFQQGSIGSISSGESMNLIPWSGIYNFGTSSPGSTWTIATGGAGQFSSITYNTTDVTDPYGGNNATKLVCPVGCNTVRGEITDTLPTNLTANGQYEICMWSYDPAGVGNIQFGAGQFGTPQVTNTSGWKYDCSTGSVGSSDLNIASLLATAGTFYFYGGNVAPAATPSAGFVLTQATPVSTPVYGINPSFLRTTGGTMTGELVTPASGVAGAGLNLPPGVAPTSPVNGDLWTTAAGLFARIAGSTVGPYSIAYTPTITTGTPTVNQTACIKAAGPPVVIGYCSTVVGAGGACTCN